jgi:hypothetical protein
MSGWRKVVVIPVVVASLGFIVSSCEHGGLSGSSTCGDFLKASPADQQQITSQLAGKYNKPDYATPLGEPEVPYYCASNPNVTLDQFFAHASG